MIDFFHTEDNQEDIREISLARNPSNFQPPKGLNTVLDCSVDLIMEKVDTITEYYPQ